MSEPRTTREALIAQMLGELDGLLARAEQLPKAIAEAETRLAMTSRVLSDAGDKYRMAVTAYTEEAKTTLSDFLEQRASRMAALTVEERCAILVEAARCAYQLQTPERGAKETLYPKPSVHDNERRLPDRLLEHGITAVLASVLTAALVLLIVELGKAG